MRKGFTLIELLVVIAIIAILAAILFPVFSHVQAEATMGDVCGVTPIPMTTATFQTCQHSTGSITAIASR